jgi:hypothetical protein
MHSLFTNVIFAVGCDSTAKSAEHSVMLGQQLDRFFISVMKEPAKPYQSRSKFNGFYVEQGRRV